jgi:hypothetical protein
MFMSFIDTCSLMKANPFDYLIALQKYASETTMEEPSIAPITFCREQGKPAWSSVSMAVFISMPVPISATTNGKPPSAMMVVAILSRR